MDLSQSPKPFLRALSGACQATPPIWLMRQAGRYLPEYRKVRAEVGGFLDLCFDPERACEVTLQPIRRFDLDAAILFSDILVIPYGLGQGLRFVQGEGPKLDALNSDADLLHLEMDRAEERLRPIMETVSRLSAALPVDKALIGFAGAPWTVATYMIEGGSSRDFAKTKLWAYGDPESFQRLMDILVETTSAYLVAQIDAGAEAVQIFDSWASALDADGFERWSIEPTRRIVERVRAVHPQTPIIGFPRGAGVGYASYARKTGVSGISLDSSVPLDWAADTLQKICPVQGNLDPMVLLTGGPAMKSALDRILNSLSSGPFIFNLGHGIIKETPPDHVTELVDYIRKR